MVSREDIGHCGSKYIQLANNFIGCVYVNYTIVIEFY